jgi:hypothetical protein
MPSPDCLCCWHVRLAIVGLIFETPQSVTRLRVLQTSMKLELERRSTQVLIGVLAISALLINWYFWTHRPSRWSQPISTHTAPATPGPSQPVTKFVSRQPEQSVTAPAIDPEAEARQAAQSAEARQRYEATQAAESHKQYLARYLNSGIQRSSGMNLVAVIAATESGKINRAVSQALSTRLKTGDADIVGTFFKPELVTDGLLEQLFAESTQVREKLELDKMLDGLILARLAVEYLDNPSLQNIITAKMSLDVTVQALGASGGSKTWTLTASGAGFDNNTARAMAEERMLKAIAADTKMSLAAVIAAK